MPKLTGRFLAGSLLDGFLFVAIGIRERNGVGLIPDVVLVVSSLYNGAGADVCVGIGFLAGLESTDEGSRVGFCVLPSGSLLGVGVRVVVGLAETDGIGIALTNS